MLLQYEPHQVDHEIWTDTSESFGCGMLLLACKMSSFREPRSCHGIALPVLQSPVCMPTVLGLFLDSSTETQIPKHCTQSVNLCLLPPNFPSSAPSNSCTSGTIQFCHVHKFPLPDTSIYVIYDTGDIPALTQTLSDICYPGSFSATGLASLSCGKMLLRSGQRSGYDLAAV